MQVDTPDGPNAGQKGILIVQSPYLCHVRVDKERETFDQERPAEERAPYEAKAFNSANASCGTFTREGETIRASWLATLDPNDEDNTSEFILSQEGDLLRLAPAAAQQFKLVYRKVR